MYTSKILYQPNCQYLTYHSVPDYGFNDFKNDKSVTCKWKICKINIMKNVNKII